jgi:hypothetical protein
MAIGVPGILTADGTRLRFFDVRVSERPPGIGMYTPSESLKSADFLVLRDQNHATTVVNLAEIKSIELDRNPEEASGQGWAVITLKTGNQVNGGLSGTGGGSMYFDLVIDGDDMQVTPSALMAKARIDFLEEVPPDVSTPPSQTLTPNSSALGTYTSDGANRHFSKIHFREDEPRPAKRPLIYYPRELLGFVDFVTVRIANDAEVAIKFPPIKSIELSPQSTETSNAWADLTLRNGDRVSGILSGRCSGNIAFVLVLEDEVTEVEVRPNMKSATIVFND